MSLRVDPETTEVVQYGNMREDGTITAARNRSDSRRSERRGYGRSVYREWSSSDWGVAE